MPRGLKIAVAVVCIVGGLATMGLIWVRDISRTPEHYALFPVMGPYYSSWASSDYLANTHAESGIACQSCHPRTFGESLGELVALARGGYDVPVQEHPDEECLECHGSREEVVQLTADLELNPHQSHLGEVHCETCHKMHGLSVDYCAQCHGPVATGPGWTTEVTTATAVEVWAPEMDCSACHVMDTYFGSLQDPNLLAYAHAQEGAECLDCHEVEGVERVHEEAVPGQPVTELTFDQQFCFGCHLPNEHTSLEQVVQRTEGLEPNPHDSALAQVDCGACHKMHKPSTVAWSPDTDCALCHLVPQVESLQDPSLLAYAHAQEGLTCTDCHNDLEGLQQVHAGAVPGAAVKELTVEMQFCFDCHVPNEHTSYEQVIELTADYAIDDQQINPHDPHPASEEVEQLECSRCHQMHEESPLVNGCYACHHTRTLQSCSTCHD